MVKTGNLSIYPRTQDCHRIAIPVLYNIHFFPSFRYEDSYISSEAVFQYLFLLLRKLFCLAIQVIDHQILKKTEDLHGHT